MYLQCSSSPRYGLMYRQLICPMMGYACPVCRHAADSHLKKLQHVQSKFLRIIAGAPWYVSNLQLHEDLEVPYIAEHIRNLAQSFDSKIPGSENLLVRQLSRYLFHPRMSKHSSTPYELSSTVKNLSSKSRSLQRHTTLTKSSLNKFKNFTPMQVEIAKVSTTLLKQC